MPDTLPSRAIPTNLAQSGVLPACRRETVILFHFDSHPDRSPSRSHHLGHAGAPAQLRSPALRAPTHSGRVSRSGNPNDTELASPLELRNHGPWMGALFGEFSWQGEAPGDRCREGP